MKMPPIASKGPNMGGHLTWAHLQDSFNNVAKTPLDYSQSRIEGQAANSGTKGKTGSQARIVLLNYARAKECVTVSTISRPVLPYWRLIMRWSVGSLIALFTVATPVAAATIHDAAKRGDVAAITAVLEAGADLNDSDGWATPLWYAARRGHEDAAKLLIARGADVNLATETSGPPLLGAIDRKSAILVKLLLASGADPNSALKSKSALYLAAKSGCLECVTALVDVGADVNALTPDPEPPIHPAKTFGFKEIADYLTTHGAASPRIASILGKVGTADAARGQVAFVKNCERCHHIELQKGNKSGPNLWGVVGRQKASIQNFSYSETLRNWGGPWSYEDLNAFLWGPMITAPGIKMQFAGIEGEAERADLIAYLRIQSDKPEPLP
jgi:cytochrome c